jgi:gas vesicle protein
MEAAIGAIIAAIIGATAAGISAGVQSKNLREAQEESKQIAGRQEAKENASYRDVMRMKREEMAMQKARDEESKRQFNVQAQESRENRAYTMLENQFGKLSSILSQNKNLEDLFINRMKGLRG